MRFPTYAALVATCLLAVSTEESSAQQELLLPEDYGTYGVEFSETPISEETELVAYCSEPACGCADAGCGDGVGCCDCGDGCCSSCAKKKDKPNPCAGSHKGLFYANDFSYLKDPCYRGCCLGDCLKLMPVGRCGRWGTLDIGGQVRLRYHDEEGMGRSSLTTPANRGFLDTENTFLLSRLRLYGDWKANDYLRVYVEGISAEHIGNSTYNPRPIDINSADLLNAFVDVKMTDSFTVRVGRQELLYGAQRTVSPLDWANTRRTFEGIRGLYKCGDWKIDGFYTNFVPVDAYNFDEADYDRSFYGLYSTYTGLENATAEGYYLGFDDQRTGGAVGANDFSLHTVGGRIMGKAAGKWLYEVEGAYQGGRQSGAGLDHSAGFITAGIGRKLTNWCWDPTLWMYFDYASGDDGSGDDFNRFNQLFPLAHKYLGFIDAVARSNVISPNFRLTMKPHKKVDLLLWYYYFGAAQENDIIPGVAVPSGQNTTDNNFGNELDVIVKYAIGPRSNILFGYSHLWPGAKITSTNDADFFYTQWTLNF